MSVVQRKRMALRVTVVSVITLFCAVPACHAVEAQPCLDQVKECFGYTDAQRDRCFKRVAEAAECASSDVGVLARRRAEFSTLVPNDAPTGPSFLGPQLVDRACIAKFDSAWSGALVKGETSAETNANLLSSLERCAYNQASDVMRP